MFERAVVINTPSDTGAELTVELILTDQRARRE